MLDGPSAVLALVLLSASVLPSQPIPYESLAATVPPAAADAAPEAAPADEAPGTETRDPDYRMRATLYHQGGGGAGGRDSLGCRPVPMRTMASDPRVLPRRSVVYIRETDGLRMADGTRHDGMWYVSDTGGAVRGNKIDLFTGNGRGSMRPIMALNTRTLSVEHRGTFRGCPPA